MDFVEFPKIARLNREVVVTEKIDGTNAQVMIVRAQPDGNPTNWERTAVVAKDGVVYDIYAGSRSRWITPNADNFGWARWVHEHAEELLELGEGSHFGEWWGSGIQRRYGLTEKRWSMFNTSRWGESRPACCHVVPELARGVMGVDFELSAVHERLKTLGSVAAPGFMKPEGYVIYHTAAKTGFKVTLERDTEHKGASNAA